MLKIMQRIWSSLAILVVITSGSLRFLLLLARPRVALAAKNLFLRKQLAFYKERKIRPQRLTDTARFSLQMWSRLFDWKAALAIVKPETLIAWHREGFRLF